MAKLVKLAFMSDEEAERFVEEVEDSNVIVFQDGSECNSNVEVMEFQPLQQGEHQFFRAMTKHQDEGA